jgi:hypothetical protein
MMLITLYFNVSLLPNLNVEPRKYVCVCTQVHMSVTVSTLIELNCSALLVSVQGYYWIMGCLYQLDTLCCLTTSIISANYLTNEHFQSLRDMNKTYSKFMLVFWWNVCLSRQYWQIYFSGVLCVCIQRHYHVFWVKYDLHAHMEPWRGLEIIRGGIILASEYNKEYGVLLKLSKNTMQVQNKD